MNEDQLSFAVFCIENLSERLGISGDRIYKYLAEDSRILDEYIIPNAGALHTQGKEYIINDLCEIMGGEGLIK